MLRRVEGPKEGTFRIVIECECGEEVMCMGYTNTCDCGIDYNMSGSHLTQRSQWGEETGETAHDILRPFTRSDDWDYGCP